MRSKFPIPGICDHYASKSGHIYRKDPDGRYHKIRASFNNCGYLRVKIYNQKYFVHRLIAKTFIPNPENYPVVMHLDNDKTNNKLSNLRWGTYSQNTQQACREGRIKGYQKGIGNGLRGNNHPNSILTELQRKEVKKLFATGKYTKTELGKKYGVTRVTIAKYV